MVKFDEKNVEFESDETFNTQIESTINTEVEIEDNETIVVDLETTDESMEVEMSSTNQEATATTDVSIITTDFDNDYRKLHNKPQINSVELVGNKSLSDLGLNELDDIEILAICD